MNAALATERLVSADSHVHFTDEWVKARLPARLHSVWDEAGKKQAAYEASELRQGQRQLQLEDFVDPEAAKDPGHFEPHAKLRAMDRDGVQAEVNDDHTTDNRAHHLTAELRRLQIAEHRARSAFVYR